MSEEKEELLKLLETHGFKRNSIKRLSIAKLEHKLAEAEQAFDIEETPVAEVVEEEEPVIILDDPLTENTSPKEEQVTEFVNEVLEGRSDRGDGTTGLDTDFVQTHEVLPHEVHEVKPAEVTEAPAPAPEDSDEELVINLDELLEKSHKIKMAAIKRRHTSTARFVTMLELTLKCPRPVCSHAMRMHFNSIVPRPSKSNVNKDVFELYTEFKSYVEANNK